MFLLPLRALALAALPCLGFSLSSTPSWSKEIYGVSRSGWTSPEWKWGSAQGTGHDCAKICRERYATPEARLELIRCLLLSKDEIRTDVDSDSNPNYSSGGGTATAASKKRTPENFEEVKLVLALAWQKARKKCYGGLESYGELLDEMEKGQLYEVGTEEDCSLILVQHMQKRFFWLYPEVEDKISMNTLLYDCESDFDWIRRRCSGLVLQAMDFEEIGL